MEHKQISKCQPMANTRLSKSIGMAQPVNIMLINCNADFVIVKHMDLSNSLSTVYQLSDLNIQTAKLPIYVGLDV